MATEIARNVFYSNTSEPEKTTAKWEILLLAWLGSLCTAGMRLNCEENRKCKFKGRHYAGCCARRVIVSNI